ncbi:MAG TPA: DNA topoisomerase IB [Acidimicrobiia bacterium]
MTTETADLAIEAGLRYVEAGEPGFRRVRRGRGFSYENQRGVAINGSKRKWIESLVIPPAWDQVWICADTQGHILATGVDKAGRKQYIYHPEWETIRDAVKFDRLGAFGRGLSALRKQIDSDLRTRGLPRARVVALATAVLDRTLLRVGNGKYARENESYGLTTLTTDHIQVNGNHVHLEFAGKGGADRQLAFRDRRLSSLVARCQELAGQTLFSYETEAGDVGSVTSSDINRYLSASMGARYTAKDFRTWGASALVVTELARAGEGADREDALRSAVDRAAERLGNTRAVCRNSYLHPAVITATETGSLSAAWKRSRPGKWIDRSESALRLVLEAEGG